MGLIMENVMNNLFWFYDIFVIGIIVIFLCVGYKRGFLRNIVFIVLVISSFVLSWFIAEVAGPMVYDKCFKDRVIKAFSESAGDKKPETIVSQAVAGGDYGVEITEDEVSTIIGSSDFFSDLAAELRKNGSPESEESIKTGVEKSVTPVIIDTLLGDFASSTYLRNAMDSLGTAVGKAGEVVDAFINGTKDEVAVTAEENLVAPVAKWLLKALIFILMMFIFRLIISPVSDLFKFANKVPVLGPVNSLLGAALGLVECAVFLMVFSLAVRAIINITGNSLIFFNAETVNMSRIFSKIYNFDIMSIFGR